MGNTPSAAGVDAASSAAPAAAAAASGGGGGGGCPVRTKKKTTPAADDAASAFASASASASADGCPVSPATREKYRNPKVYNVYSQEVKLDPKNNMPANPNQLPAPGQEDPLDTTRVKSTIPKGGTDTTWEYPSPQMFWNAMVRKNKSEGAAPTDMDMVVAIHNNMNETTWRQVMAWEALHRDEAAAAAGGVEGAEPTLLRFTGRPDENSPKAKLKSWILGCPAPFDRHDWIVDRGGKEVRYIIDYYHDDHGVDADGKPSLHDTTTIRSIKIDVRPALDSPEALFDRAFRMPFSKQVMGDAATAAFKYLPLTSPRSVPNGAVYGPSNPTTQRHVEAQQIQQRQTMQQLQQLQQQASGGKRLLGLPGAATTTATIAAEEQPKKQKLKKKLPPELLAVQEQLQKACRGSKERLEGCGEGEGEEDCNNAYKALVYCMGQVICKDEADVFRSALEKDASNEELGHAFEAMSVKIGEFEQRSLAAMRLQK
jgi:cytochrome c heme-lyase